jgi:hypothetical protein
MSDDDVETIIARIENSKTIETLNLSNRGLKFLPATISSLVHLKYLYLDNNKLIFIPEIGNLIHLEEFSIENNELTLVPESCGNLRLLKMLNLSRNSIKCLSSSIFQSFQNLTVLWLNQCGLLYLPKEVGHLLCLEKLGLKENFLEELPGELGLLSNLKWLNLEKNQLFKLPDEFQNLKSLSNLNLGDNGLEEIPSYFYDLKNLHVLSLKNNKIRSFKDEHVLGLSFLNRGDFRGNPCLIEIKHKNLNFYEELLKLKNFLIYDE